MNINIYTRKYIVFLGAVVRWQAMQNHVHNRMRFISDYERDFAWLVSELRLRVLNAAPSENRWWRFTANQRTSFTDEMRMRYIAQPYLKCKMSLSSPMDVVML